jgi:uroporphyrinogen decarboxylase
MTSRERILAALHHREPDRVPIDFSGHRSSGIMAIAYARLRDFLGFPKKPIRVYDPIQQLAIVDEDVLQLFRVDTIELGRAFCLEDRHWTEWVLPDGTACLMPVWARPERIDGEWVFRSKKGRAIGRMPDGVLYFEQSHFPLMDDDAPDRVAGAFDECMWTALATPPGPSLAGPDADRLLREGAGRLRKQTDRAILGLFGGNLLEIGQYFYRNDNFFMLLAGDPDRAHRFLDQLVSIHLANLDRFLAAVNGCVDVVLFGDDFGMQQGPQISQAMYREFFKPRQKILWGRVKERTEAKVMLHCCGGVRELLPDMIEAGLDAINPVQISCRGMSAGELKEDFGRQLTFWGGGCDTREVLIHGTSAQVREHVRRQIETWRPGGGYVFQQVHNIMADVPPANIVAMFEAAQAK